MNAPNIGDHLAPSWRLETHTRTLTHAHTHTHTHTLTLSHTHSLSLSHTGARGTVQGAEREAD